VTKEVKLILACNRRGLIGNNGKIPWHFPEDFKHFKETTDGHVVAMGRKTWESLPRKPLINRDNWILSRNMRLDEFAYQMTSVNMFTSLEEAHVEWLKNHSEKQHFFIIGGAQIYHEALSKLPVSEVIMTLVQGNYEGDTFFNLEYMRDEVWDVQSIMKTNDFEIQRWRLAGL
jgi:dihydrofolate reductase